MELHPEANLLQLEYWREQHVLNLMYVFAQKHSNHKLPAKTAMKTRSSNKLLLGVKRLYTEKLKKGLCYSGPKKWNSLPAKYHLTKPKQAYMSLLRDRISRKALLDLDLVRIVEV